MHLLACCFVGSKEMAWPWPIKNCMPLGASLLEEGNRPHCAQQQPVANL